MRILIQRVARAWLELDGTRTPPAGQGLVALVGFREGDGDALLAPMAAKMVNLRIFEDEAGRMNRSLLEVGGDLVLVPQFTLYANSTKGRRPSFIAAQAPETAAPLFERFVARCREHVPAATTGRFGAMMQVHLVNDGPVTILLDSDELNLGRGTGA